MVTIANQDLVDLQTNVGGSDSGPFAATKKYSTDVLFTYLLHPGTAVYVGYNDGISDLRLIPTPPFVTANGVVDNSTSRLFFVKLSYLFRY